MCTVAIAYEAKIKGWTTFEAAVAGWDYVVQAKLAESGSAAAAAKWKLPDIVSRRRKFTGQLAAGPCRCSQTTSLRVSLSTGILPRLPV